MVKLGLIGTGELQNLYADYLRTAKEIDWIGNWAGDDDGPLGDFILKTDAILLLDTPDPVELVLTAFRSGRHVLLDSVKLNPEQIDHLIGNRKEAGVFFHTGMVELFHPDIMALKARDIHPRFIEVYRVIDKQQPLSKDLVMSELLNDIAIISYLVESDIKRVAANGLHGTHQQLELVNARLEFANGCVAVLTVNHLRKGSQRTVSLYEETRVVDLDLLQENVLDEPAEHNNAPDQLKINLLQDINKAHINRLNDFVHSILEKSKPMLTMRDTYKQVDIAHRIMKKINSLREE